MKRTSRREITAKTEHRNLASQTNSKNVARKNTKAAELEKKRIPVKLRLVQRRREEKRTERKPWSEKENEINY